MGKNKGAEKERRREGGNREPKREAKGRERRREGGKVLRKAEGEKKGKGKRANNSYQLVNTDETVQGRLCTFTSE